MAPIGIAIGVMPSLRFDKIIYDYDKMHYKLLLFEKVSPFWVFLNDYSFTFCGFVVCFLWITPHRTEHYFLIYYQSVASASKNFRTRRETLAFLYFSPSNAF